MGGLKVSDQALQISTKLPSDRLYGFGETEHHSYKHDMQYRHWGMWARDQPVMVRSYILDKFTLANPPGY